MSCPTIGIDDQRADAARRQRQSRLQRGIAQQRLQKDRQQHQAGVQHEAQHGHEEHAGAEGAVLQHAQIDDRMFGRQLADDHADQSEDAEQRPQPDLGAAEPVFALAGIEHHLQHAEAEREKSDAPQIDAAGLVLADVVRIDARTR